MDDSIQYSSQLGTPLRELSEESANRRTPTYSPGLENEVVNKLRDSTSSNRNSDVLGKVAQFNNLSKEITPAKKANDAALRRAVLGREEAEGELKKLREENQALKKAAEEGRSRERKVSQRLEVVMEELQRTKETKAHSQALYEKEVRKARKEAFRSSSSLVKMQEELKTARNRYTLMREEAESQRRRTEDAEGQAFAQSCKLIDVQQLLDFARHDLKLAQDERDTLKTALKQEEVARIAAEGRLPLPQGTPGEEFFSPKKLAVRTLDMQSPTERIAFKGRVQQIAEGARASTPLGGSDKENEPPREDEELDPFDDRNFPDNLTEIMGPIEPSAEMRLEAALEALNAARKTIKHMKVECQFELCACRVAESQGQKYVYDRDYERKYGGGKWKEDIALEIEQGSVNRGGIEQGQKLIATLGLRGGKQSPSEQMREEAELKSSQISGSVIHHQVDHDAYVEFDCDTGTFNRQHDAQAGMEPAAQLTSPAPSDAAPAPPLAPVTLSESPSLFELGSQKNANQRPSDDCLVLSSTPRPQHPSNPTRGRTLHRDEEQDFTGDVDAVSTATASPNDSLLPASRRQNQQQQRTNPPLNRAYTTTTTTTTVPLAPSSPATPGPLKRAHDGESNTTSNIANVDAAAARRARSEHQDPYTPGATVTRQEALERVAKWRQGRDRARSVTTGSMTPRRPAKGAAAEGGEGKSAVTPMRSATLGSGPARRAASAKKKGGL